MRGILSLVALSAVLSTCGGCLALPNLAHPGTEERQQARAQYFEPFPENEAGPAIVGARPREYRDPRPAFAVLQDMHQDRIAGPLPGEPIGAPCPQSPLPIAQPPIITPPPAIYYPPVTSQP